MSELSTCTSYARLANVCANCAPVTASMLDQFVMYCDVSKASVTTYTRNLHHFFDWLAERGVHNPDRLTIMAYRDDLKARLKPTTVQNYLAAVKVFFEWTELEGYYPNIARRVKGAKLGRDPRKAALAKSQVSTILESMDADTVCGARDAAIFRLMVTCGLRTCEVMNLNVEDITVRCGKPVLMVLGKGREEKVVAELPPKVEAAIRAYWKKAGIKNGPAFQSTSNNSKGGRISTRTVSKIAKEVLKAAGYDSPALTAHSLRHTAVTNAIHEGRSVQEAQAFARHADIKTTMIYYHEVENASNQCAYVNELSYG